MRQAIGKDTRYYVLRTKDDQQRFLNYNVYNGSFEFAEHVEDATAFEDKQVALDLTGIQRAQNALLKNDFIYETIEQVIERKVIDPQEEPENAEEPENIEDPESPDND